MEGQMSLFEFVEKVDINEISEEDMVRRIGSAVGLVFVRDDCIEEYRAKVKGVTYHLNYSNYSIPPYSRFISVGVDFKNGGSCCPCDSLDVAIRYFKGWRRKYES